MPTISAIKRPITSSYGGTTPTSSDNTNVATLNTLFLRKEASSYRSSINANDAEVDETQRNSDIN